MQISGWAHQALRANFLLIVLWNMSNFSCHMEDMKIPAAMSTQLPTVSKMPCFSGYFVLLKTVHVLAPLSCDEAFLICELKTKQTWWLSSWIFTIAVTGWYLSTDLMISMGHTDSNRNTKHCYLFFIELFHTPKLMIPLLVHLQKLELPGSHSK